MIEPVVKKTAAFARRPVLLGVADRKVAQHLTREVMCHARTSPISIASTFAQLREASGRIAPAVILLDEELEGKKRLADSLRVLTTTAPVVLLASVERHGEMARLVAEGNLEFVARTGDFVPLAASLIERRLRWQAASESVIGPPWAEFPGDLGEIFRHEINNPLTGILGNAELNWYRHECRRRLYAPRLRRSRDLNITFPALRGVGHN